MSGPTAERLRLHGDRFAAPGMLDFAVNVWPAERPPRLRAALLDALERPGYPDERPARRVIAARHRRPFAETLPLSGACEGFWLLAKALRARHAACLHPTFTEAEVALRAAGTPVTRVMRLASEDWALRPERVPDDADFVVLVNPNNPTANLDSADEIGRLARPGRTLVVDESFIDFVSEGSQTLATATELPGLVLLRSLTKIWGLAALRAAYLLAPAPLVEHLVAHRQPWSVSAPALAAIEGCLPDLVTPAEIAAEVAAARGDLCRRLAAIGGVRVWPARANFVLIEVPEGRSLVSRLAEDGIAVRPCDTFPGLGPDHIRLAVRTPAEHQLLAAAITRANRAERGNAPERAPFDPDPVR